MDISIQFANQSCSIFLSGTLTYQDHFDMASSLKEITSEEFSDLIICLGDLEFVDSAGLALLLMIEQFGHDQNAEVSFRFPRGQVRELLRYTHLAKDFLQEPTDSHSPAVLH